jgi:polar amino acid transport system permease protein
VYRVDGLFRGNHMPEWVPRLLHGAEITVLVTVAAMAVALAIGFVLALMRMDKSRLYLVWPSQAFVEIIRGTPLLVQLFYIFYVLPFIGIRLDTYVAGILGLAINYGAYLSEVFRSGIEAIPKGQWEASDALGMTSTHSMRRIILPQAIKIIIPPVGNYFIALFKDSALVATIAIPELLLTGQMIASETFQYVQVYTAVFVIYFIISFPASLGLRWLERQLASGAAR